MAMRRQKIEAILRETMRRVSESCAQEFKIGNEYDPNDDTKNYREPDGY
jgi:hypothetical protein